MARKMAIANEVRENRLLRGRRVAADHATSASKRVRQVERQHSVAKPKRGKQCLRKCPQINYAFSPRVLETLQRTPLPSLVLQLRIEIVLDDPGAILMAPIQYLQTSVQSHGNTQRPLAGGSHKSKSCIGRKLART